MIEKIKTIMLVFLVISSIFLTWQIWTYQPQYDYILPTEYVTHEGLAEKKEVNELIKPQMIVYHHGNNVHTVSYPEMVEYTWVYEQMPDWYFFNFREIDKNQYTQWQSLINHFNGIELSFAPGIPFHYINEFTQARIENKEMPPINRIWIYQDPIREEIYAMFISEDEQKIIRARTGMSVGELTNYMALGERRPKYKSYVFTKPKNEEVYHVEYLSTQSIQVTEYRYFYKQISMNRMIQYLFVDSSLVRELDERNGGIFYTDGSRGLEYYEDQHSMYYIHPMAEQVQGESKRSNHYLQRSIQFVNQHQGWEHSYYLDKIEQDATQQEFLVQFRKYLGNYPVFTEEKDKEQNVIQLELKSDRVVGYYRPLIEIDRVMGQVNRTLPAGTQLIEALESRGFSLQEIERITIGYKSEVHDYYLSYKPYWVIQLKNGERLFIRDIKEDLNDELE